MNKKRTIRINNHSSSEEKKLRSDIVDRYKHTPIPDNEILSNLGLYINRQNLSRLFFLHELYKQIIDVNGIIVEFGCRWGQNLSIFTSLRGIYEPYNYLRKIVAFDTFTGFTKPDQKDGTAPIIQEGSYTVTENYQDYLEEILSYQEQENPLSHIKKFEIRKGDASIELERYLSQHPETIIALAFFDFDLYKPTKDCLALIQPYITKGSILSFDQLNFPDCPGETIALREILDLQNFRVQRSPFSPTSSYIVI